MKCRLCGGEARKVFTNRILDKYDISYFLCGECDLLQAEDPYWLDEAYSKPINDSDTGLLTRNLFLSIRSSVIFNLLFDRKKKFIDYAGGYGVFTRLMRDIGFDFYWNDPYTKNLFSIGFENDKNYEYEALTSFESFEHFVNPVDDFAKMLLKSSNILLSTTLRKEKDIPSKDWWYYGTEHGQHVSFYSGKTMQYLAEEHNLNFYTDSMYFSLFTKKKINPILAKFLLNKLAIMLFPIVLLKNKSRTLSDREKFNYKK